MTAVAEAAQDFETSEQSQVCSRAEQRAAAGEAELLDVLYEVLAQGVPPGSELTTADVERFLHQHARSPKSIDEMLAFFRCYNLPTSAEAYGADDELRELASGLHRDRGPVSSVLPLDAPPIDMPEPTESGEIRRALPPSTELVEDSSTVRTQARAKRSQGRGLQIALGAVALCSVLGFGASYFRGQELEGELRRANLQLRATDTALTSLEQRAEGLRGALDQSEAERRALSGRFEQFAAEAAREQAAEQDVLRRMLGKRYDTLRSQRTLGTTGAQPGAR
jgi:hypothetical protein